MLILSNKRTDHCEVTEEKCDKIEFETEPRTDERESDALGLFSVLFRVAGFFIVTRVAGRVAPKFNQKSQVDIY